MSRSARLFDLIQALRRHRRAVSAVALAEELGVSKRTIYRDIETLIALGAPIDGAAGVGYLMKPGFILPPLMFTEDEVEALALSSRWVAQRADPDLVAAAENALAKIAAVLPVPLTAALDNSGLLSASPRSPAQDSIDPAVVRAAIRGQRKLRISYADEAGRSTERVVWPIALVYFEAVRLLVAWCEMRTGFRHFRSDRIAKIVDTGERYPRSRQTLTKAWRESESRSTCCQKLTRAGCNLLATSGAAHAAPDSSD
jgi:predicted DNA-binding transcriptional regulator YafY